MNATHVAVTVKVTMSRDICPPPSGFFLAVVGFRDCGFCLVGWDLCICVWCERDGGVCGRAGMCVRGMGCVCGRVWVFGRYGGV